MASLFLRGKTWWVSYYRGGNLVRQSLRTRSKRVAQREQQAIEAEIFNQGSRVPEDKNPLVGVLWEQYVEWAESGHIGARTLERKREFWQQLMTCCNPQRLGDLTPADIEKWKRWRRKEGNAPQTINNGLTAIKAIYNRATKQGWYTGQNPTVGVEAFTIKRTMPTFHTEEELARLLDAARNRGQATAWVVLLGAWAGLRRKEIISARWEWFSFDKREPVIHLMAYSGFDLKDHEDRSVPMNTKIRLALHPHRKDAGFLFESDRKSAGLNRYRFDPKKSLVAALRDAGLGTREPFQRLRHTFGSLLAQRGVSIFKVSRWMGHSSVRVTERHYAGLQAYDDDINAF
ncbi:MAG: tyrosine-type recombinase/integrase [Nitrospiraceae bacterium]|nr:tyrosine-type recombinase/integrase [Nitrospiraceae bacterium]